MPIVVAAAFDYCAKSHTTDEADGVHIKQAKSQRKQKIINKWMQISWRGGYKKKKNAHSYTDKSKAK